MELREYLSVRRAYNLVRQQQDADVRLTFAELAILCHMSASGGKLNTSQIAEYQGVLRPTMTHRTKHLSERGLINRTQGAEDRRNVACEISEEGSTYMMEVCARICEELRRGAALTRTTPQRVVRYVDAMGAFACRSGDLVLLGISGSPDMSCTVSDLVSTLGLLQPTVSMSISSLEEEGLVVRDRPEGRSVRSVPIRLTVAGAEHVDDLIIQIRALVVRRDR